MRKLGGSVDWVVGNLAKINAERVIGLGEEGRMTEFQTVHMTKMTV
jgi:hypothetical protein